MLSCRNLRAHLTTSDHIQRTFRPQFLRIYLNLSTEQQIHLPTFTHNATHELEVVSNYSRSSTLSEEVSWKQKNGVKLYYTREKAGVRACT